MAIHPTEQAIFIFILIKDITLGAAEDTKHQVKWPSCKFTTYSYCRTVSQKCDSYNSVLIEMYNSPRGRCKERVVKCNVTFI